MSIMPGSKCRCGTLVCHDMTCTAHADATICAICMADICPNCLVDPDEIPDTSPCWGHPVCSHCFEICG